ncbi:MAG: hypothetical protein M1838_002132 [Thelocarpon superellum]|nr:MAG: hypothetical protein M1838_002132 [Thelocarpon superellum]
MPPLKSGCEFLDLDADKVWSRGLTQNLACNRYHSVRIDAVHYCHRETELSEKRKRRSFFDRNGDPKDVPQERLQLLSRTVRGRETLAVLVQYLKMPYMTRETNKADLARTVSVLPNLKYVDLPEGFFSDDPSCLTLKHELHARCPELRKMKYAGGSEASFTTLASGQYWQMLETVELANLNVEMTALLGALGALPLLHDLKITDMPWLDDEVFRGTRSLPPFPPLQRLSLENTPSVTAVGLGAYLSRPESRETLSFLSLITTGVQPSTLHEITSRAPHLSHLAITETVSRSFPLEPIPPLASSSLETLYYEITSASDGSVRGSQPTTSYYDYLTRSLHAAALPHLRSLYVRDATFPESLICPPPPSLNNSPSSFSKRGAQGFNQSLDVYSKGLDELEWNFTCVSPPAVPGKRGNFAPLRPISAYRLSSAVGDSSLFPGAGGGGSLLSPRMSGMPTSPRSAGLPPRSSSPRVTGNGPALPGLSDDRKSMIVGNGFGGYLAVPNPDASGSPTGSGSGHGANASGGLAAAVKRGSRADIWR